MAHASKRRPHAFSRWRDVSPLKADERRHRPPFKLLSAHPNWRVFWPPIFILALLIGARRPQAFAHDAGRQDDVTAQKSLVNGSAKPSSKTPALTLQALRQALRHAKSSEEARALEERAETLRQASLSPRLRLLLAQTQAHLDAHEVARARAAMNAALVLSPPNALLRRERAKLRYALGDIEGALEDLGVSLHIDADDPQAWRLLAEVEEERKDVRAARAALLHLKRLDPMARGVTRRLEKLKNPRRKPFL